MIRPMIRYMKISNSLMIINMPSAISCFRYIFNMVHAEIYDKFIEINIIFLYNFFKFWFSAYVCWNSNVNEPTRIPTWSLVPIFLVSTRHSATVAETANKFHKQMHRCKFEFCMHAKHAIARWYIFCVCVCVLCAQSSSICFENKLNSKP